MKDFYQIKKNCPYRLRENTYRRVRYLIVDYDYFKGVLNGEVDLIDANKEEKLANCQRYVSVIEASMQEIPETYVEAVLLHLTKNIKYSELQFAHEQTIKKWVQCFVWHVAEKLGQV